MIVAIYKTKEDAQKRAKREGAAVVPTKEAHLGVADAWPDYPFAVVRSAHNEPDAWAGRQAEAALARPQ